MDRRRFKEPTEYGRLPKEYQEVEYLENSGTQYIDTGIISSSTMKLDITAEYINSSSATVDAMIFGSQAIDGQGEGDMFYLSFNNRNIRYRIYGAVKALQMVTDDIPQQKMRVILDAVSKSMITEPSYNIYRVLFTPADIPGMECVLFGRRTPSGLDICKGCKVYICKVYDNDVLVRDFIPCYRKSDNKPGMYDLVSNQFYTNDGTGEFSIGPEIKPDCDLPGELGPDNPLKAKFIGYKKVVPEEYQEVYGIRGDGQAFIETNYYPTNKCKFETKARRYAGDALFGTVAGRDYGYAVYPYRNLFGVYYGGKYLGWDSASSGQYDIFVKCDGKIFTIKLGDSQTYTKNVDGFSDSYRPLMLFATRDYNNPEKISDIGSNIIYSLKFWENEELILDLIPCIRKSDGVAGFYNNGNKQYGEFLTNTSGNGALIAEEYLNSVEVYRLWDYKRGTYNPTTGEFTKLE